MTIQLRILTFPSIEMVNNPFLVRGRIPIVPRRNARQRDPTFVRLPWEIFTHSRRANPFVRRLVPMVSKILMHFARVRIFKIIQTCAQVQVLLVSGMPRVVFWDRFSMELKSAYRSIPHPTLSAIQTSFLLTRATLRDIKIRFKAVRRIRLLP